MLFSNPLVEVSQIELLRIWGELVESYHGVNGHGGDTAELYACRFQRYSPMIHGGHDLTSNQLRLKAGVDRNAAFALVALVEEFCREYNCSAEIDGIDPAIWCKEISFNQRAFDHRAQVKVKR